MRCSLYLEQTSSISLAIEGKKSLCGKKLKQINAVEQSFEHPTYCTQMTGWRDLFYQTGLSHVVHTYKHTYSCHQSRVSEAFLSQVLHT